jgi:hypothetical protein
MSVSRTSSTARCAVIVSPLAPRISPAHGPAISTSNGTTSGGASPSATAIGPTAVNVSKSPLTGETIASGVATIVTRVAEPLLICLSATSMT